jgi:hypothetical protein
MPLPEPLRFFIEPLEGLALPYAVTGSVAASFYGEPRSTYDVDIVLLLRHDQIEDYCRVYPESEFYSPPTETLATEVSRSLRGSFNLIHHGSGYKADVYLAGRDSLHSWALANRRRVTLNGGEIWLAPPEYVILRKLEFFRESGQEKHARDVRFVVKQTPLDRDFLRSHIERLGLAEAWTLCAGGVEI